MRRCFYHTEGGVSGESTVTTSIFLAFRELKIATNLHYQTQLY